MHPVSATMFFFDSTRLSYRNIKEPKTYMILLMTIDDDQGSVT